MKWEEFERAEVTGDQPSRNAFDPARYEGVYAERPTPEYQIVARDLEGRPTADVVMSIPRLERVDRTLVVEYIIRAQGLDDRAAAKLIILCLLREFLADSYANEVDMVDLCNLQTGASQRISYRE